MNHRNVYRVGSGWTGALPEVKTGRCWSWCSAPRFLDEQEPLRELLARYPQAKVIGCSGR